MSKQQPKPQKQAATKSPEKKKLGKRDSVFSNEKTSLQDEEFDQPKLTTADIICDPEFEKLQINEDELQHVAAQALDDYNATFAIEHPDKHVDVSVRRPKAWHEIEPPKRYAKLLKPTTPDAPLKPIPLNEVAGARCDLLGNIVPHSILGDVEEFKQIHYQRQSVEQRAQLERESREAARRAKREQTYVGPSEAVEEDPAFRNYKRMLAERDAIQKHLGRIVQRTPQDLLMNVGDQVRAIEELRYLLDRALPLVGDGKGYRVGSEFWQLPERIGDEIHGLFTTLSDTEKGFPPEFEQIGVPLGARSMDGVGGAGQPDLVQGTRFARKWLSSPYLRSRIEQLRKLLKELAPQYPAEPELLIVHGRSVGVAQEGRRMTQSSSPRTPTEQTCACTSRGASPDIIATTGHVSSALGAKDVRVLFKVLDSQGHVLAQSEQAVRLVFETCVGDKGRRTLLLENRSPTTVVYVEWRQLFPVSGLLQHVPDQFRREPHFYFRCAPSAILPGASLQVPIAFKSSYPGWYRESWQCIIHPHPTVPAEVDYPVVKLHGVCADLDRHESARRDVQRLLQRGEAEAVSRDILNDLLATMQPPERPSTPIDAYYDEAHRFYEANRLPLDATPSGRKQRYFHKHAVVQQLKALYSDSLQYLLTSPNREAILSVPADWDLDLRTLKWVLMQLDEAEPKKQVLLEKYNKLLDELSLAPLKCKTPNVSSVLVDRNLSSNGESELTTVRHALCYRALVDYVDRFACTAQELKAAMQQNVNAGLLKIGVSPDELTTSKGLPSSGSLPLPSAKLTSKKLQDKMALSVQRSQKDDLVTVLACHFRADQVDLQHSHVSVTSSSSSSGHLAALPHSKAEPNSNLTVKIEPLPELTVPGYVVGQLDHIVQSPQAQAVGLNQVDLVTGLFWLHFREKLTLLSRNMLADTVDRIEQAFDNADTI